MNYNNSRLLFLVFASCFFIFGSANNSYSRTKLSIFGVGNWDFDISNLQVQNKNIERNQSQTIRILVKTIESNDNAGNVRVDLIITANGKQISKESKTGNIGPKRSEGSFEFNCSPEKIGNYKIDVEVWGGAGHLWLFDTTKDGYYRNRFNLSFTSVFGRNDYQRISQILNEFAEFFSHNFWEREANNQSQQLLKDFVSETFSGVNLIASLLLAGSPAGSLLDAANNLKTISQTIDVMGFSMALSILLTVDQNQELSRAFREAAQAYFNEYNINNTVNQLSDKIDRYENIIRNKRMEDIEGVSNITNLPLGSGLTGYNKAKNTLLIALGSARKVCKGLKSTFE